MKSGGPVALPRVDVDTLGDQRPDPFNVLRAYRFDQPQIVGGRDAGDLRRGNQNGAAKDGATYRRKFTGKYSHKVLDGIGHNVPQEAPLEFANAIREVDGF